jgi:hypothetical protein
MQGPQAHGVQTARWLARLEPVGREDMKRMCQVGKYQMDDVALTRVEEESYSDDNV